MSAVHLWSMQIKNREHDLADAAGKRAWDLGIAAALSTDPAERSKLLADARLQVVEACTITGKLWERMADERGLTFDDFVASNPTAQGTVASLNVLLSNLDGIERETAAHLAYERLS